MERRIVQVFYGPGKGKTSAAVGQCIREASLGQRVTMIQFLKGKDAEEFNYLDKLEPDIRLFRFEKSDESYDSLLESQKKEEKQNIRNGMNFARKVIDTGECDVLVLDEVLGLLDIGILTIQDIYRLIEHCGNEVSLLMTGKYVPKELLQHIDIVSEIVLIKNMA